MTHPPMLLPSPLLPASTRVPGKVFTSHSALSSEWSSTDQNDTEFVKAIARGKEQALSTAAHFWSTLNVQLAPVCQRSDLILHESQSLAHNRQRVTPAHPQRTLPSSHLYTDATEFDSSASDASHPIRTPPPPLFRTPTTADLQHPPSHQQLESLAKVQQSHHLNAKNSNTHIKEGKQDASRLSKDSNAPSANDTRLLFVASTSPLSPSLSSTTSLQSLDISTLHTASDKNQQQLIATTINSIVTPTHPPLVAPPPDLSVGKQALDSTQQDLVLDLRQKLAETDIPRQDEFHSSLPLPTANSTMSSKQSPGSPTNSRRPPAASLPTEYDTCPYPNVVDRLYVLMTRAGLNRTELATVIGLSQSTVSRLFTALKQQTLPNQSRSNAEQVVRRFLYDKDLLLVQQATKRLQITAAAAAAGEAAGADTIRCVFPAQGSSEELSCSASCAFSTYKGWVDFTLPLLEREAVDVIIVHWLDIHAQRQQPQQHSSTSLHSSQQPSFLSLASTTSPSVLDSTLASVPLPDHLSVSSLQESSSLECTSLSSLSSLPVSNTAPLSSSKRKGIVAGSENGNYRRKRNR